MWKLSIKAASLTSRGSAFIWDCVIAAGLMAAGMYATLGTVNAKEFLLQTGYLELSIVLAIPLAVFSTYLAYGGATPGMIAADITALRKSSKSALRWREAILRSLLWPLSVLPAGLGLLPYFATNDRQTLHDLLSGTIVVQRPFIGVKLMYEPWRVFWRMALRAGPIIMAIILGALLIMTSAERTRNLMTEATIGAMTLTLLTVIGISTLKVHFTRVRLTPSGVQRSGVLGWRKKIVPWADIEYAGIREKRYFSYLKCKLNNNSSFRMPIDRENAMMAADELRSHGVRIE